MNDYNIFSDSNPVPSPRPSRPSIFTRICNAFQRTPAAITSSNLDPISLSRASIQNFSRDLEAEVFDSWASSVLRSREIQSRQPSLQLSRNLDSHIFDSLAESALEANELLEIEIQELKSLELQEAVLYEEYTRASARVQQANQEARFANDNAKKLIELAQSAEGTLHRAFQAISSAHNFFWHAYKKTLQAVDKAKTTNSNLWAAVNALAKAQEEQIAEGAEDLSCRVCLDRQRSSLFLPCKHLLSCAEKVKREDGRCPLCRTGITSVIHVYF